MLQVPSIKKDEIVLTKATQRSEKMSFQRFLQLKQLKYHRRLLEKELKDQDKRELRKSLLNKRKIVPPQLKKAFIDYNPEVSQQMTSKKISCQIQSTCTFSNLDHCQLPKIKNPNKLEWSHRWYLIHRKDEINSLMDESSKMTTIGKVERNRTEERHTRRRMRTDPKEGEGKVWSKKSINF